MINSGQFDGTPVPDSIETIIEWLASQNRGEREINFRLRDWLISPATVLGHPHPPSSIATPVAWFRSRTISCRWSCPLDAEFTPTGQSPLVSHASFLNTTCPACGGPARRETDTMDTFVDSSWYWFRYTSPQFTSAMFDPEKAREWTPVDLYTGGIEHAILHLLYARFFTKVLRDLGLIDHDEPFKRLRNQGMILSVEGTKMSKSRGTQVSPDAIVTQWGGGHTASPSDVPGTVGARWPVERSGSDRYESLHSAGVSGRERDSWPSVRRG